MLSVIPVGVCNIFLTLSLASSHTCTAYVLTYALLMYCLCIMCVLLTFIYSFFGGYINGICLFSIYPFGTFSGVFFYVLSLVVELVVIFRIVIFIYIYVRRKCSKFTTSQQSSQLHWLCQH